MNAIGKYIFGIIDSAVLTKRAKSALLGRVVFGERVYIIPYQDISAVVCDSEIVDYRHLLKDTLARQLIKHQQISESIMSEHTVIPMRLGTYAVDETAVLEILSRGYPLLKETFPGIKDRIEMDVAAVWKDFNLVLKRAAEEKEIKEFKERLLANPAGVTVDEQMKAGLMVKKAIDKERAEYAGRIQDALSAQSCRLKTHELMDDQMVLNCASLIKKGKQQRFESKIEALNSEFNDELNFRCVGPLPAYSFYTLEVRKMDFQEIDCARKTLGLNDTVSLAELKRAHLIKASLTHPDKNSDVPGIERIFDAVNKAYRALSDYCQGYGQPGQNEQVCFAEEAFQNNKILVRLKE